MKIYLAATAPGNESSRKEKMLLIKKRLLSFYFIRTDGFEMGKVFNEIKKVKNEDIFSRYSRK